MTILPCTKGFSFLPSPARQLPCFTPLPSVRDSGIWATTALSPSISIAQDQYLCPPIPERTWDHPCPSVSFFFPSLSPFLFLKALKLPGRDIISHQLGTLEMGLLEYRVFLPSDLPGPYPATSLLHGLQGVCTRPQMEAGTASLALWQLQGCFKMSRSALRGQGTCNSSLNLHWQVKWDEKLVLAHYRETEGKN